MSQDVDEEVVSTLQRLSNHGAQSVTVGHLLSNSSCTATDLVDTLSHLNETGVIQLYGVPADRTAVISLQEQADEPPYT